MIHTHSAVQLLTDSCMLNASRACILHRLCLAVALLPTPLVCVCDMRCAYWLRGQHVQDSRGHAVWYQLLLSTLKDSDCRDMLQREAAVLEQLQQGLQDPRPVQIALQEARARAELLLLQVQLDSEVEAATQAYSCGCNTWQR